MALRTGQILSFSDLARDVGIAPNTAKQWISVLQTSGKIVLLEPYHRNLAGYIASRAHRSYPLAERVHVAPGSFIDQYLN